MGESDSDKEIKIRTLTGESTTVSISPNNTIKDLKLLLQQTFSPACLSPTFHLFLKGVKLSLQSKISSHLIGCGEFIVLVPFTKKDQQQTPKLEENVTPSEVSNQCSTSKLAESAWSAMMQDLSSLQDIPCGENQPNINSESKSSEVRNKTKVRKCKSRCNIELQEQLLTILYSRGDNVLDEADCERFIEALDSVNCLSDTRSGNCMLGDANIQVSEMDPCENGTSLCFCPPWLKTILKAFYFLNIYSAFLQLQQRRVTLSGLNRGLEQLVKFGFGVVNADIEHLSLLCPQVVQFVNDEAEGGKFRGAIVIIKSPMDLKDQVVAKKGPSISNIVSAMRKREASFIKEIRGAVNSVVYRNGNETAKSFSLENVLLYVKEGRHMATENEAKGAKRSWSGTSSSFSSEARCNETNPLLPVEMVEHLRKGIGSRGQIVHVEEINGRKANYVEFPSELSENTQSAIKSFGITSLYSHQAESIQASLAGKNVVVATMTSSGKSLCYNLPVLEVLSQNFLACALYLFPTKALAQDQLRALLSMTKGFNVGLNIGIYDGDTAQEDRMWQRDNARLIICS